MNSRRILNFQRQNANQLKIAESHYFDNKWFPVVTLTSVLDLLFLIEIKGSETKHSNSQDTNQTGFFIKY
jgi:hypothetical protein